MSARRLSKTLAVSSVIALFMASGAANAQQATLERVKRMGEIRVCLDQGNLPYSSDKADLPGFDTEVSQAIAKELGVRFVPFWYATNVGKRALRQMHGENNCDFFPGLPHDASFEDNNFKIALSKPYYTGGFATLARADAAANILADTKAKGVGVQMGTLPDFKLFDKGFERKLFKSTDEVADALEHKEIDAAVLPAPEAAWLVKSKAKTLKVLANTEKEFLFPISIGVRKADKDLLAELDKAIDKLESSGRITEILGKYGMVRLYDNAGPAPAPDTTAATSQTDKKAEAAPEPQKVAEAQTEPEKKTDASPPAPAPAAAPTAAPGAAPAGHGAVMMMENGGPVPTFKPGEDVGTDMNYIAINPEFAVDPKKVDDFPSDYATIDKGRKLYKQACYKCHGPNGVSGGTIPDLRKFAAKADHYEMFAVIQAGRPDRGMPAWNDYLTEEEIKQIIVYVKALHSK